MKRWSWVAAAVVTLTACSSGSGGSGPGSTSGGATTAGEAPATSAAPPTTVAPDVAVDQILAEFDDNGELALERALAIVDRHVLDLPGIEPAGADVPDEVVHQAWGTLEGHQDRLSPEVAAAIAALFAGGEVITEDGAGPRRASHVDQRVPGQFPVTPDVRAAAADAMRYLSAPAHFGRSVPYPIDVRIVDEIDESAGGQGGEAGLAWTDYDSITDAPVRCHILWDVDFLAGGDAELRSIVFHEIFHCFQKAVWPADTYNWIKEGTAMWASNEYAGRSSFPLWWLMWMTRADRQAAVRGGYGSGGLFYLVQRSGVDLWRMLDEFAVAVDGMFPADQLDRLIGYVPDADTFFRLWGTHHANEPGWGDAWDVKGGDNPDGVSGASGQLTLAAGASTTLRNELPQVAMDHYWAFTRKVNAAGDVLRVTTTGTANGGLHLGSAGVELRPAAMYLCISDTRTCACPAGSSGPSFIQAGGGGGYLGVGPSRGASVTLTSMTLTDACADCVASGAGPTRAPHVLAPAQDAPVCAPTDTTVPGDGGDSGAATCIVGRWVTTKFLGPVTGEVVSAEGGSGVVWEFGADGRFRVDFGAMVPYQVVLIGPDHGERITNSLVMSGAASGTYAVADGKLTASAPQDGLRIKSTTQVAGVTVVGLDKSFAELGAGAPGGGFAGLTVTCAGDTLLLTNLVPGAGGVPASTVGWELSRAG